MKTIKHIALRAFGLLMMACAATAFTACSSDDDPFFTAEETDAPRILNTNIPEWKDGQPQALVTQSRTSNFVFNIIATPRDYTTISWYLDGQLIHEGDSIDQPLLAGDHELKIVATTTKGLSTSRTTRVVITPADGDPVLGTKAKDLWVAPGAKTTIHGCANLDKVSKVFVGGKEASIVSAENGNLTLTMPADLTEGDYRVVLQDAAGQQYGGGTIKITNEPYPDKSETLWEGSFNVTWGTPFDALKDDFINHVHAGTILKVYVNGDGQGTATTAWWNNLLTGKGDPERGDITISGSQVLEYELTDLSIQLLKDQNGFLMVGNGYTITKVTVE